MLDIIEFFKQFLFKYIFHLKPANCVKVLLRNAENGSLSTNILLSSYPQTIPRYSFCAK